MMGLSLTERRFPLSSVPDKHLDFYRAFLAWDDGYYAEYRQWVEHFVRLLAGDRFCGTQDLTRLARALSELAWAVHFSAFGASQRAFKTEQTEPARLKKQDKVVEERSRVAVAVKTVWERGISHKHDPKRRHGKIPDSDPFAESIRDEVLQILGRPKEKPSDDPTKPTKPTEPSVRSIRRAIKQINDGALGPT
jgi:hypothetical protein